MLSAGCRGRQVCEVCLQAFAILLAFLSAASSFQARAFAMYLEDLKRHFYLRETSVELCMGLSYLGFSSTFPAGYLITRCGLPLVAMVGMLISTASFLLIWSAINMTIFYSQHAYLLQLYFFFGGCGSGISFVAALTATARRVTGKGRGAAMGFLGIGMNIGPIIYTLLYEVHFKHVRRDGQPDLRNYFLFVTLSVSLTNFMALLTYFDCALPQDDDDVIEDDHDDGAKKSECLQDPADGDSSPSSDESKTGDDQLTCKHGTCCGMLLDLSKEQRHSLSFAKVVRVPLWHYIIWSSAIMLSMKYFSTGNITTFLASFDLEEYEASLLYLILGFTISIKFIYGFIADHPPRLLPLSILLLPPAINGIMAFILAIFLLDNIIVIYIACILWTSNGITVVVPLILIDDFGLTTFSSSIGMVYAGQSVFTFLSQLCFGALYDLYAIAVPFTSSKEQHPVQSGISEVYRSANLNGSLMTSGDADERVMYICEHLICYLWSFILGICFCVMSAVLLSLHMHQIYYEQKQQMEEKQCILLEDKKSDYGTGQ